MTSANDQQLVSACCNCDKTAYDALVDRYYRRVFAVCLGVLGSAHDAEDAVQEALLKGFERIGKLRTGNRFGAWVTQIARNVCIDHLRRRSADVEGGDEDINRALDFVKSSEIRRNWLAERTQGTFTMQDSAKPVHMPVVPVCSPKVLVGLRLVAELQRLGIPDESLLWETIDDRTHQDAFGQAAGVLERRGGLAFAETGVNELVIVIHHLSPHWANLLIEPYRCIKSTFMSMAEEP